MLKGGNIDNRILFPIDEKYRDLLYLIISLHHIETQEPKIKELLLETYYLKDFNNVKKDLENLYELLTGRNIILSFKQKTRIGDQSVLNHTFINKNPILFSGGVDSVAGSLKLLENNKKILLHVASSKTVFGKVRKTLANDFYNKNYTYCINSRIKSKKDRTAISNTRGLLYLTSGYVINRTLNSDKTYFCENGGQLLDVMLSFNVYVHSRATKNTNLRYLNIINDFLNTFDNRKYNVNYVFKNHTKSETIAEYIPDNYIISTWSCYNMRRSKMCGSCWNCFITNMSAIAAGINEKYLLFDADPLTEIIDSKIYLSNQNIIYDLLVYYEKVINYDEVIHKNLNVFNMFFKNTSKLARDFGLDIFLGVKKILKNKKSRSGLGIKAESLLKKIKEEDLENRKNYLYSLRRHTT